MRTWKANWCASCGGGANFGDQLTPHLLRHYGVRFTFAKPNTANLFATGSIASKIPNRSRATIVGTGIIRPDMRRDLTKARVLALRGPLTAERCGVDPDTTTYGDPGILAPDLNTDLVLEDTGTVIAPHYVDKDLWPRLSTITKDPTPLAVTERHTEILRTIAAATTVHTSSLHIFILADAYGIPVTYHRHDQVIGDGFKFDDYASGMSGHPVTVTPGTPYLTPRKTMTTRQAALRSIFTKLK